MTNTLGVPGSTPRILAPTTTVKMALRMLSASRTASDHLPTGLYGSPGLDILLTLYVAEDDARYLSISELNPPGTISPAVTQRWVKAAAHYGLIECRDDLLALSEKGYATVTKLVVEIYAAQRTLD